MNLQLSSGSLHALRTGQGGGVPVICIPGLSANARSFDAIAAALRERPVIALEPAPGGGVRPRTSKAAVLEDAAYGAMHDPRLLWPSLRMPTLLLRSAQPILPGTGFVVGAKLRDAFLAAVPTATALDVDANH